MLGWLKKKTKAEKLKKKLLSIVDTVITIQTALADVPKREITNSDWGLGYFFGVVDGICQYWGITNSPETIADQITLFHYTYKNYWNPKIPDYGMKILSNSFELLAEDNKEFFDGLQRGGNDVLGFIKNPKTHTPMGLYDFL